MSRTVCGICWCPYDDDTGACACEPELKAQHMTDLRTAAQQALEVLESAVEYDYHGTPLTETHAGFNDAAAALRAALEADDGMYGAKALTVAYENGWNAAKAEPVQQGCDHCNSPLYAATRCRVCGRETSIIEPEIKDDNKPDVADDLAFIVRNAIAYIKELELERQMALNALVMMRDKYGEYACPACDHADAAIAALKGTK